MVDNPNPLLVRLGDDLEALILVGDVFEIGLGSVVLDGVALFVVLDLLWHLGDLDANNGSDLIISILSFDLDTSGSDWFLFAFFSLLRVLLLAVSRVDLLLDGILSTLRAADQLDLLDPTLEFTGTHVADSGVESVQIPETFVNEIKHVRVKFKLLNVVLD